MVYKKKYNKVKYTMYYLIIFFMLIVFFLRTREVGEEPKVRLSPKVAEKEWERIINECLSCE